MSNTPMTDSDIWVTDTPRTDEAIWNRLDRSWMDGTLCRQLERELNAANERIQRLEEVGDRMVNEGWNAPRLAGEWRKAKEAKP